MDFNKIDVILKKLILEEMNKEQNKVFLGGTCNKTTWRDELIPLLNIDYFNPVVEDWTEDCQKEEENQKENKCNIHFYMLTNKMTGVFSVAEVVDSVHDKTKKTVLQIDPTGFDKFQIKSLTALVDLINKRGGTAYISDNINEAAKKINNI